MSLTPDEAAAFVDRLPTIASLDKARRWWPMFVYRSDHVENIARILNAGCLLSRAAAELAGTIAVDSADLSLVADLDEADRRWVRLYFRPRAPTQFANEGVRPRPMVQGGAHMPVPVYLLFQAPKILSQRGVVFTKGRMTKYAERGSGLAFLESMNWRWVYHDSGVGRPGSHNRAEILNARHSEVLVPDKLDLKHLRWVVCRSAAERDTLLNLLDGPAEHRWMSKVRLESPARMFWKRATFVQQVNLASDHVVIRFFVDTKDREWRGPFLLQTQVRFASGYQDVKRTEGFYAEAAPHVITLNPPADKYDVKVTLDDALVYLGRFIQTDQPTVFT